ncbi:MAG: GAF domain-containing sensor histidine kinase [Fimbriimonadaceae bacterium]|nr:GAF domain-containing sensor histidine kinase [Fimbriimonadaceae bacterium]QYK57179.1 MAG: GAF domain-containing sensor histidine kinase [Fimbriimonadaceae bacterium]
MKLTIAESSRLLEALHGATRKLASSADPDAVLRDVLTLCVEAVGAEGGTIYIHDPVTRTLQFAFVTPEDVAMRLERLDIPDDYGVVGRVFQSGTAEVSSFPRDGDPNRIRIRERTGLIVRNMITVPLQIKGSTPIGAVQVVNKRNGNFNENDEAVLESISDVSTMAITNARLLEQQTRVASLEGMGRAAHDLANKAGVLSTITEDFRRNLDGLKEALGKGPSNSEACYYLEMLETSLHDVFVPYGERVYRYARLINDLAAGKELKPKMKKGQLVSAVEGGVTFLESQARRNHVRIVYDLQQDAPELEFDDLFVMRVMENLVGNAIKAVNDSIPNEWLAEHADDDDASYGTVTVRYRHVDGCHMIEVADDGPGMSPATIRSILSGKAVSQWDRSLGTGLGTKVVVELVRALGGRLSIRSKLGEGSTFVIELGNLPGLPSAV